MPSSGTSAVSDAVVYSLEAGGKRIRPILTLAVAETIGSEEDSVIDVARAIEYIHTYSLIHDDLPAMDNSDLRRGKPTCHCVYGEAIAILAGDALLTMAFETIAGYGLKSGRENKAVRIIHELASASGIRGMIGGQELDLKAEGVSLNFNEIAQIAAMKTGALIKAAIICGAIAADASADQKKVLSIYAQKIGPAFQIVDDLLDYESTAEKLGKPTGADQVRLKATYPAAIGIAKAREHAEDLYCQAVDTLKILDCPTDLLKNLAQLMVFRTS